jgi:hypothetical protein
MTPQPTMDPHGWYTPGLDIPYISPNTFSLVLNYRHDKLAVTPALQLNEGTTYGTPGDVIGIDPRNCRSNSGNSGLPAADPLQADYTACSYALTNGGSHTGYLFIPNPQTGTFASFGQYRQPWQFNLGLQVSYDFSARVSGRLMMTNLINSCFGGSKTAWTSAYAPSSQICGYTTNTFYVGGGFFNGSGPNDLASNGVAPNPYFLQSYVPAYGDALTGNYPLAFNMYFSLQFKL